MRKACVYFHQGWTDIINCLPLINYYRNLYDEIVVLARFDAKELVGFYTRSLPGVSVCYLDTDNGRFYGNLSISPEFDILFHAEHDIYRRDKYAGYWRNPIKKPTKHFVESFYTYYDIPYTVRITDFSLDRNLELEEEVYKDFIEKNSKKYILYHDDEENHSRGSHHVSTKIEFPNLVEGYSYVNLNKLSSTFFDFIKVLENAKELHLIDSVWASICYQLDARYGLLSEKEVKVYCKRGHKEMFLGPVVLDNWVLLE